MVKVSIRGRRGRKNNDGKPTWRWEVVGKYCSAAGLCHTRATAELYAYGVAEAFSSAHGYGLDDEIKLGIHYPNTTAGRTRFEKILNEIGGLAFEPMLEQSNA